MKLVSDWRKAWKWHSTHAMAIAAVLPIAWAQLPNDLKSAVPDAWLPWIAGVVLVAGIIGRVVDQE